MLRNFTSKMYATSAMIRTITTLSCQEKENCKRKNLDYLALIKRDYIHRIYDARSFIEYNSDTISKTDLHWDKLNLRNLETQMACIDWTIATTKEEPCQACGSSIGR